MSSPKPAAFYDLFASFVFIEKTKYLYYNKSQDMVEVFDEAHSLFLQKSILWKFQILYEQTQNSCIPCPRHWSWISVLARESLKSDRSFYV